MTDQGDSPTEGQFPSLDTAHVKGPSLPELSVNSAHGNPVAEKLSPLQDHSFSLPEHAASLSEWDFVSKEKSEEGSAPSIRSVISISSDSCEYLGTQAATTSVVAERKKGVMPYNNTAIPPSEEITGSTALPLARVKRILQLDEDISACSNSAAFAITVATEMFVRYLAEKSLDVVKSERKPRRNIQYKDVANAVARFDNLEFLSDVVPKTITYGEHKRRKAEKEKRKRELQNGQTTLNASRSLPKRQAEVIDVDEEFPDEQDEPVDPPVNGHVQAGPSHINGNGDMEDHETNEDSRHGGSGDVEMN